MLISEKILELRKNAKLSQGDMAEKLGVSRQSISKWETGASIPELDKIIIISKIFGVSIDYLVKDDIELTKNDDDESYSVNLKQANHSSQKIVGYILTAIGGLSLILSFIIPSLLLIAIPVLVAGILAILIKKYAALKIVWIYAVVISIFSQRITGGSFMVYWSPSFYMYASRIHIIISILALVTYTLLFWRTIIKFRTKTTKLLAFFSCLSVLFFIQLVINIFSYFQICQYDTEIAQKMLFSNECIISNLVYILTIVITLFFTIRYYKKSRV